MDQIIIIHLRYLLSTYYVAITVLGTADREMNKTDKHLYPRGASYPLGKTDNKHVYR